MIAVSKLSAQAALAGLVALAAAQYALACPFCAAVSLTFNEEIANSQVAVIAKLTQAPPKQADNNSTIDVSKAKFEVVKVLKGEEALGGKRAFETVYFGDAPVGSTFLVMGIDPPQINWGTPIAISQRGVEYVSKSIELPKDGPDRLAFFQDYLEDSDELLARDAYDEFAKMPYAGVVGLKDRMKHDKLVEWIKSPQIPVSRRRLYLTMLGVFAKPEDLTLLEEMIKSKDRQTKGALDALVAAYLTLKGPDGMPLVEDLFLKNKDAEYTDTYATIMALRFHGTEEKIIPRQRLLEGIRTMLDRPQLADLVIPDLARWEDWSVVDRLVELFKNADEDSNWVRVPVINYLRACPLPKAKTAIDELAKIDPESVKRASTFFPVAGAAAAPAATTPPAANQAAASSESSKSPPAAANSAASGAAKKDEPKAAGAKPTNQPAAKGDSPAKKSARVDQTEEAKPVLALATDTVLPSRLPVVGGLAAVALLFGCAFWAILKGGQHVVE